MVGFKSIALLLSLLIFAACVPQTKQTECGSNEAFNAALRTCVPVVNGPSSFISIDSFLPTSSLTKYKNDTTPITLSIVISNPYAQTYTVEWERIFSGVPVSISPSTPTSYSFAPSYLATEVGTHIISVKIKDTSNNIVDSHSFEVKINDNPKPIIQSSTVTPALYASTYTPSSVPQNFSFTVKNNGATMTGAGYRTDWKLYRAGVLIDSETDTFPTSSPAGSLSSSGSNYPVYAFDPFLVDGTAIGAYTIIARVTNTAAEVVAEQQWSATVSHPSLSKITNRDIYSASASPAFAAVTTAYDSVAYTASTTLNFIPTGGVAQGDYCVSVASGEGTYTGDSDFVRVDYYLDGGTLVYSGLTSAIDNKVCLTDALAATLNSVIFSNSSSLTAQSHTLVARVVDEATGQEYATSDMNSSLGTYPVTWNFNVKPQNAKPTVAFGTLTTVACPTTAGSTKSGCTVTSDTNFTVRINLASDDFYYTAFDETKFDYSIRLYDNGVNIQTCTKTDPGYTGATDVNGNPSGGNGYECVFRIESYNGTGPINLNSHSYQIQAEISDTGSPISGTGMTSSSLTWNFAVNGVDEYQSAPTLGVWSVSAAIEGSGVGSSPITFSVPVSDAELDNFNYTIRYCTDDLVVGVCPSYATLTSGTITRTTNTNPYPLSVTYTLPEDFLLGLPDINCDQVLRNTPCNVNFDIVIEDDPDTETPEDATSNLMISSITNTNPPPTLNTAGSSPAPSAFSAATTFAFVGNPISISNTPSSILADTSAVAAEKTYRYQWFIRNNLTSPFPIAYTEIVGATGPNLIWTPSHIKDTNVATDNPLSFILCVEDHPAAAVTTPNITDSTCNDPLLANPSVGALPWTVTVLNNLAIVEDLSAAPNPDELANAPGDLGTETAIWYEAPTTFNGVTSSAAYIAMIGNDKDIHIKKVLVKDRAAIDTLNATDIVSMYPLATGVVDSVKDLSITGTATELYVAYLASETGAPGSFYPQVRRIDLLATAGKTVPNIHEGKFGFDYNGLGLINNCNPSGDCTATAASGVTSITFNPSAASITQEIFLQTPNGNFEVNFGTYNGIDTICSTCSGTTMASNLATLINASTDPLLAGYSAIAAGNTVTINGARSGDYFDAKADGNARIADRMGKIYVSGGNWYLPFINTSLGGGNNDKLSVYTASTGGIMSTSTAEAILEPSTTAGLASMDAAIAFDNYYDGTNLWIAMVSKTGSAGRLYKVNPSTYAYNATAGADWLSIMASDALLDIQVAGSTTNAWVIAKTSVASDYKIGVYDINVDLAAAADEFEIDNSANVDASSDTDDYFNYGDISSLRIIPYGTEARLFAVSKGTSSPVAYKLYAARLRKVSSLWTLSCGDCQTVSESSADYSLSSYVSLGVAPIRDNPSALYRLSSDGSFGNQGIKDVAFVSFGRTDIANAATCDPAMGVFNMEGENIDSTTIFAGANPNEDAGLFRPPFIKN